MATTSSTSGNTARIDWTFASTRTVSGLVFSFDHVDATLGGVTSLGRSGNGNVVITAGYSQTVTYTVAAYYTRTGHSDSVATDTGSVTTGPGPAPPSSAVYAYDAGGGNITIVWNFIGFPGYVATSTGYTSVSGSSEADYSNQFSQSTGSESFGVGYSTAVNWFLTDNNGHTYSGSVTTGASGGGGGTAPAVPNPATGLVATLTSGVTVSLSWTAPAGGSSSVEVRRNGTALTTSTGTTYTDSAKPAGAVTYQVFAVNTNAYGVTYAGGSNAVTVGGAADSAGILQS